MAAFYRKDEIPEHLQQYFCPAEIGLEATPDAYVQQMVAVFREVRRVLKDDGVLWLNLGDSYAATRGYQVPDSKHVDVGNSRGMKASEYGAKAKDLLGIPWRVAFALQADGWYLRSDVIWHKPNPMPESVTDRPTKAHEYLFLLTKSERYFYDADAIREPHVRLWDATNGGNLSPVGAHKANGAVRERGGDYPKPHELGRNRRTVWTVPTTPYSGAHFATMPEKLVEPCVLAGSRPGDLVFDPFLGSGTVGAVAERLGRRWVGTDLNTAYHGLAKKRTAQRGLFLEVSA